MRAPIRSDALDQAAGLRRLFAAREKRLVPLVANPLLRESSVLLERLASTLAEDGARLLVVDAADSSPAPLELADIDLPACIEPLGRSVRYLAARGLPRRHVDPRGSSQAWLSAVEQAAPDCDVVLLHASARDLVRMLGQREVRPVVLTGVDSASLTDAYASVKLLAQRSQLRTFDLLISEAGRPQRAEASAQRLASTADSFLGAVLLHHACVDARQPAAAPLPLALQRLGRAQLGRDRKSTRLNSSHSQQSRMPSSA